ncbi:hypothetical protein M9Y10_006786 [Tritrichomonas musculus]|uniref:DUF3447 domain-containing protein n=1 Tax=Tritrichomonas musculus TaxID=1915356 RepID=A0ABR2JFM6_9EUKA
MCFLQYIENEDDLEESYQNLLKSFNDLKIEENKHDLLLFLYIISQVANNHYRSNDFFEKIEKIIVHFKSSIKTYYSISEILQIFEENKRMILMLIDLKIITLTNSIVESFFNDKFRKKKYAEYFFPEIKNFLNQDLRDKMEKEMTENFDEKRREGENDHLLCKLIREDLIEEFIVYINKENFPLDYQFTMSTFETHPFLFEKSPTLFEYASFFGSIQIFRYLLKNNAKPAKRIKKYAIHGDNQEIIDALEIIKQNDKIYLEEAIKCHHNHMANYLKENFVNFDQVDSIIDQNFDDNFMSYCYKYYNMSFIPDDFGHECIFYYLCKYNYFSFVEELLKIKEIDINKPISKDLTPLRLASFNNNIDLINLLLSQPGIQIGKNFSNCRYIKQLSIPSSVIYIEENAFLNCSSLFQMEIPPSIISIGNAAFQGCSSLIQISIPTSVTLIGDFVFKGCTSLKYISIPSSIISIGKNAFDECTSLEQISIPSSVTSIGDYAFQKCKSLKKVIIPNSMRYIESFMFNGCTSLKEVIIPSSVTSICQRAFNDCPSLKQIHIPTVKIIGEYAFNGCKSLTEIALPLSAKIELNIFQGIENLNILKGIAYIPENLFFNCTQLKQITIPSSVISLENYAFKSCTSLQQIQIPSSVTSIPHPSFKKLSYLIFLRCKIA